MRMKLDRVNQVNRTEYMLLVFVIISWVGQVHADSALDKIEVSLEQNSTVRHVDVESVLYSFTDHPERVFLFDVREVDEYEVSHLSGAIRLDPDTDPQDFLDQYGQLLGKGEVVFYCSVGRRSTELAEGVADIILAEDPNSLALKNTPANMKGGIFHWHNESLSLVDSSGATDVVHPYNWFWKRLLIRKEKVSYLPAK